MEAGAEAYAAALVVYSYVKFNSSGDALEVAADDLGRRFGRKARSVDSTPTASLPKV